MVNIASHRGGSKTIALAALLLTIPFGTPKADESVDGLHKVAESMGISLSINDVEPAIELNHAHDDPSTVDFPDSYIRFVESTFEPESPKIDPEFVPPSAEELHDMAAEWVNHGTEALLKYPSMRSILTEELLAHTHCDTFMPQTFLNLADQTDNDESGLTEELRDMLIHSSRQSSDIDDTLGPDWTLEVEAPAVVNLDPLQPPVIDIADDPQIPTPLPVPTPDPSVPRQPTVATESEALTPTETSLRDPVITIPGVDGPTGPVWDLTRTFVMRANPMGRTMFSATNCERYAREGVNIDAWLAYRKHPEFTIRYKFCGPDALNLDRHEFDLANKRTKAKFYSMPDNSLVPLEECRPYGPNCAPQYIQMIAADILYQRRILGAEGFKLPGHWNIEVKDSPGNARSSAFLGTIRLFNPAFHSEGLRGLVFHEYFHAIQTTYGSEWAFPENVVKTGQIAGRAVDFTLDSDWWSQLESLASWSTFALEIPFPTYTRGRPVDDARNHLLKSAYHPLEFGFIAERYTKKGNNKPSTCLGCDAIKKYLSTLDSKGLWNSSYAALHNLMLDVNNVQVMHNSTAKFLKDYHLELMFSSMNRKWATTSPTFRFLNRRISPSVLTEWPPRLQTVPADIAGGIGSCKPKDTLVRANAVQVGSQFIAGFNCDIKMAPTGAVYLRVPLEKGKLPNRIVIGGVGVKIDPKDIEKTFPDGDNFKTLPGEFIEGNLRIFAVPVEQMPADSKRFEDIRPLSLYGNAADVSRYVIDMSKQPDANALYLAVEYPYLSFEWWREREGRAPQGQNFMARTLVVGYWDR